MVKGIDFVGIGVAFFCHDGKGNFLLHKRSGKCRDEHGRWDVGGGGLRVGERLEDVLKREVHEEYGVEPLGHEFLGFEEVFREHEGKTTHWLSFRFKVLVDREAAINGEPEMIDEIGWFSLDNLPSPLHSQLPHEIEIYQAQLRA
jgi:8-oxo-dGTP diphosphatase